MNTGGREPKSKAVIAWLTVGATLIAATAAILPFIIGNDEDDGVAAYQREIRPICARIGQLSNIPGEAYAGPDRRYDKAALVRDLIANRDAIRHELTLLDNRETPSELEDKKQRLDSLREPYLAALSSNIETVDRRLPARPTQQQFEAVWADVRSQSLQVATDASQAILDLAGGTCALEGP